MKTENRLKEKIGTEAGFKVPEGYFDEIYAKISESLPERKAPAPLKLSTWQRLKPYVYLAAMFAGIWCTLKMVSIIGDRAPEVGNVSLDNPPALVAQAIQNEDVVDATIHSSAVTDANLAAAIDDMEILPEEDDAAGRADDFVDVPDAYDVDINQLQAALDVDDYSDYDYYF
ncbi:MAG: hypothetical protein HDS66_00625 [Bacteroidales bacterium]|nr:hypothetical protein [Bacteroidales bacterium]